ncbi:MAG TPA: ABC transporter ATP-binding protein [Polyangiaceae bacterium]|nr:ABC transporter ATP-binding protein [Polyangiaceae bacterium]
MPISPSPPPTAKPGLLATKELFGHTRRTLSLVWASSPSLLVYLSALSAAGAVMPLAVAYAGKRIIDAVVQHSRPLTLHWVALELLFVALSAATQRGQGLVRSLLGARLGTDVNVQILEKALRLDLSFFEDAEFYDKLTRARREASSRPVALLSESFSLVQNVVTLLGYAVMLAHFSAWIVLGLLLATLPATLSEMRYSKIAFRIRNWRSPESRKLLYLEYVLANDEHVKEVKLFGIGPHLLDRYRTLAESFFEEDKKLAIRRALLTHAFSLIGTFAFYATYGVLAVAAALSRITLGNLTLYVVSLRQGQQSFQSVLSGIGNLYEHNLYMSNLFSYIELAEANERAQAERATGALALPAPHAGIVTAKERGLRFENVGFHYPGKERWALRHIDLTIAPGDSIALVGENGAGKTTFVKLLAGLYQPSEGRIILDGRDLSTWNPEQLRLRFGVLFQDFNKYQLKLRENIGLGSVPHLADEARIERAVERGGASELLQTLPGGLDAALGHWFEKGSELSGGQWQKVALARAFMREEADMLVLDEPTAALDAASEHAVFERFRELAKGRTTIVISHRFPTVRMAKNIIVLEHGEIVEHGSHEQLLEKDGKYAHMFKLQAQGYQ